MSAPVFGFKVYRAARQRKRTSLGWLVSLPHQCDTWDIAGEAGWTYGVSQEEAIAELEAFIEEAKRALAALRAGQEFEATEEGRA